MILQAYLPQKPTAEKIKDFRNKQECSYQSAKAHVMRNHKAKVKEGLLNAVDACHTVDDLRKVLHATIKELL